MNIINIEHLTKAYTDTPLFDDVSFTLDEGEKVGLIGVNGTGKSTLLRIIAGIEQGDSGKYTRANNLTIAYLPQVPVFNEEADVLESVLAGHLTADESTVQETGDSWAADAEDRWTLEADAKRMLNQLGIYGLEEKMGQLSGGQRKRAALVRTLLSDADVLILDEPTNHLDAFMSEWLEDYLRNYRGTILMVTHDRYFLDAVTRSIVEIDHGKLYSYDANYRGFLQLKQEREEMQDAAMRKLRSMLRVELQWMQRGAEARRTKQKKQIRQYEEHAAVQAPERDQDVQLSSIASRMGRSTIELDQVSMCFGDHALFRDFSYTFLKNDRIGFVGPNGCGKTTLMRIISGELQPSEGEVRIGQTIRMGYYAQELQRLFVFEKEEQQKPSPDDPGEDKRERPDPETRVIDYIRDAAEYIRTDDGLISASQMLERFLFTPEKQYTRLGKLSGGELRRLHLLRVLMLQPNVLILDEPTNDLDIRTLMVLEDFLDSFSGIVITVSHDRYFLDRVVRRIFAFEEGSIRAYEGGYTDYLAKRPEPAAIPEKPAGKASGKRTTDSVYTAGKSISDSDSTEMSSTSGKGRLPVKLKFSYKEQREYETIDADIEDLEQAIAAKNEEISANATDFEKLSALSAEKEQLEAALSEKMDRWVYLNELAEMIRTQ